MPKRMRRKIGKPGPRESFLENRPDGRCVAPMGWLDTSRLKRHVLTLSDLRSREDRIIRSEKMRCAQFFDPLDYDVVQVIPQRKKVGVDALGEFRLYPVGFLTHQGRRFGQVHMPKRKRHDRPVTHAGQYCEGDQRTIAAISYGL